MYLFLLFGILIVVGDYPTPDERSLRMASIVQRSINMIKGARVKYVRRYVGR